MRHRASGVKDRSSTHLEATGMDPDVADGSLFLGVDGLRAGGSQSSRQVVQSFDGLKPGQFARTLVQVPQGRADIVWLGV